jgi:hypothetical protein
MFSKRDDMFLPDMVDDWVDCFRDVVLLLVAKMSLPKRFLES